MSRRPFATCDSLLVLDYCRHFDVVVFLANAGLQNAIQFGRGKICRRGGTCPLPRSCFFLHFTGQISIPKQRLRTLRSVFVRNIGCRLNASQFVQDRALQRALSVGEGHVCLGHERQVFCRLLHFDPVKVLRNLNDCQTIAEIASFASRYALGRIVTQLEGVNAFATHEMQDDQRRKVESAFRQQYSTRTALANVPRVNSS